MEAELRIGPVIGADSSLNTIRGDRTGALVSTDAHGRFNEATRLGRLFSNGMSVTAINAATFTTGTLGATCTPILGVWNPIGSGKYLSILQARLQVLYTALQMTPPGAFVWATSILQSGLTLGTTPLNRASLVASGSVAKGLAGIALTGLSGNLTVQEVSALGAWLTNISTLQTAAGFLPQMGMMIENIDGAINVPPGGALALLGTTTPVGVSAASSLLWEELDLPNG